ncbi:MAG: NAD(P)-dependent oxidoreductase [Chloroflexota bacterium]|jgi:putative NADH-flavin reductase
MHLVIFGASGRTGNHLVRQAIGMGHDVTAFVRRPNKLPLSHERLRVIVGDARDRFNVDRAIHHADAVITTIAPVLTEPEETLATIAQTIIQSMHKQRVTRLVTLSDSYIIMHPHFKTPIGQRLSQLFTTPTSARWLRIAQQYAIAVTANPSINWSIVRTHQLVEGDFTGQYIVDTQNRRLNVSIKRANAADFMLRIAVNGNHIGEMPIVSDK